jgi:hypothetical protein
MKTRNVILIILALIVIGVVAYFLFLRPSGSGGTPGGATGTLPSVPVGNNVASGTLSGQGGGAATVNLLDAGPVAAYFVNTSPSSTASGTVTLVRPDGTITLIGGGQSASLSSSSVNRFITAVFSHDGRKIAISSGDVSDPQVSIFDVAARSWMPLGMGLLSPVWGPNNLRLAYLRANSDGTETLYALDFGKARPASVSLGTFYVEDMALDWVSPNEILLASRPSAYTQSALLAFNVAQKTLTSVVPARAGFYSTWGVNASGTYGLAFSTSQAERGGHLQLIDQTGAALQNLSFLTLPSKCTFGPGFAPAPISTSTTTLQNRSSTQISSSSPSPSSSSTSYQLPVASYYLYCAIPRDQESLSYYPLPDTYSERALFTLDDIYRINVATGHIDVVLTGSSQNFDVSDPLVAGNMLYFVNRYDQKLYSVQLPD